MKCVTYVLDHFSGIRGSLKMRAWCPLEQFSQRPDLLDVRRAEDREGWFEEISYRTALAQKFRYKADPKVSARLLAAVCFDLW